MNNEDEMFPRELSAREFALLEWLLPADRPGYARVLARLRSLFVIGEGRWGRNDLVLGAIGDVIDRTEGMQPVLAFGELRGTPCSMTVAVHMPNEDGQIEFQLSAATGPELPADFHEESRWTYSYWLPGQPCPAHNVPVREVPLPAGRDTDLRLVIAPQSRVLWLHDGTERTNTLIPVTSFYNELVLTKNIRDPKIALNHRLLFDDGAQFTDHDLSEAFIRYNVLYRKVGVGLFDTAKPQTTSFWNRLFGRGAR